MANIQAFFDGNREVQFRIKHCEGVGGRDDYDTVQFNDNSDLLTIFLSRKGTQELTDLLNRFLADEKIRVAQKRRVEGEGS